MMEIFGGSSYRVEGGRCPACHARLDAATDCGGEPRRPREGDFTLCLYCASILRLASGEDLLPATEEDLEMLRRDAEETYFRLMATRAAIQLTTRIREAHQKREQALLN